MEGTIYSLIPPVLAILMVILTRRVLISLGVGILASALLLAGFNPIGTVERIFHSFLAVFTDLWYVYILVFIIFLGIITAFISVSGGSVAFGEWAAKRIKSRRGSKFLTVILGIVIFIDDYFNSLAVGQISRPITDRYKVSRAKLAYLIDSTSAPICVIAPISSWGAYIIATLGGIFITLNVTEYTGLSAFMQMIPMNLYVFSALLMVFLVAYFNVNIGAMKTHETRAMETGELVDSTKTVPGEFTEDLPVSEKGKVGSLLWPIIALMVGVVAAMFWTGYTASEGDTSILAIFENTDPSAALFYGGIFALIVTFVLFALQSSKGEVQGNLFGKVVVAGVKAMLPAVYILLLAWSITGLISDLETGTYLADRIQESNMNIAWLPIIIFLVAGFTAFATGTSWGTFGLLLPIAAQIAVVTDIELLLPALAAVLAGAVFGDHCSPISDTTILSSTGANSNHIDHVLTQLPYALISAAVAAVGYIVLGLTGSTLLGLAVVLVAFIIIGFSFKAVKA
ncbi:Na+/H+ antiporter NhaC family protein [Sutcliffiella cohnii]|uniref:Na+/H+ antiporter NhaC family protein n=1 Tax=Sutcliffiella cohnii TaxID=33932 RepID=UPI002E1DF499|nr:Na+/H+ antiporter NhaC family protein [Sutcliffiella cohnii]